MATLASVAVRQHGSGKASSIAGFQAGKPYPAMADAARVLASLAGIDDPPQRQLRRQASNREHSGSGIPQLTLSNQNPHTPASTPHLRACSMHVARPSTHTTHRWLRCTPSSGWLVLLCARAWKAIGECLRPRRLLDNVEHALAWVSCADRPSSCPHRGDVLSQLAAGGTVGLPPRCDPKQRLVGLPR
jgi:hypothetical protein